MCVSDDVREKRESSLVHIIFVASFFSPSCLLLLLLCFFFIFRSSTRDKTGRRSTRRKRVVSLMFATIQTTSGKSNIGGFGTASLDKKRRTRCEARGRGGEEEEEKKQRREIKVCTKKECRRLGSQKTIEFLEERAGKFDLRVTSVKCLSECGMGPNVELPCGTVLNGVKGEERCLKALARTLNEGEECDFVD